MNERKRGELTTVVSYRAAPHDVKALQILARRRGQTKSEVVRSLIHQAHQAEGGQQQGGDGR